MSLLQELKFYLSEPAYLGPLCNWGLVWMSYFGMISLMVAVAILKDRKAMYLSLAVCLAAALMIIPAEHFRKTPPPVVIARAAAVQKTKQTRQQNKWMFYTQAALAGITMLVVGKSSTGTWWLTGTLLGSAITGSAALWMQLREMQLMVEGMPHP
jgi:hypothetical protein